MDDAHWDAIIVGSGFGGSVVAYRLAEAGLRVCLLERGRPYPPDSFPRTPHRMKDNFWDPSAGLYGMFNVWSFRGSGAVVSSGLGGGSLIYANVLIRKDEKWFVQEDLNSGGYEYWPVTRADLDPHYDLVERMMNVQKYPIEHEAFRQARKTLAMREAAEILKHDPRYGDDYKNGLDWQLLNLAVSFRSRPVDPARPDDPDNPPVIGEPIHEAHPNLHHRTRTTCRLCGECDIGCNYGSKNTLDYTYLSEAQRLGADLRTLCEVRAFEPRDGGGFTVRYVQHDLAREGVESDTGRLPLKTITCDRLVLSAGTFGTPFLLLKNRSAFPRISQRLGTRFCVNGDLLSFILRSHEYQDGRAVPRVLDASFGPVITSAIRVSDFLDGGQGRGFYVEDGGYPAFFNWLLEASQVGGFSRRVLRFGKRTLWGLLGLNLDTDLDAEISDLIGACDLSKSSMPVLSMGRDIPSGRMRLRGKYLDVDWRVEQSQAYYNRLTDTVRRIAGALQADYRDNLPHRFLRQVITAHPLGGCPMGRDENEGVVDPWGEVFNYPGLYVADGSAVPGPVGPNPSLTIAALADRFADRIVQKAGKGA